MSEMTVKTEMENNLYQDIMDNVTDGIYFLNTDRVITYWNRGAERITGFTAEEVVGSKCMDNILVHVTETGESICHSDGCPAYKAIQTGRLIETGLVYLHHKDGHRLPVSIRVNPVRNSSGQITGAVEVFAERKSKEWVEAELARLKRLAIADNLTGVWNRRYGEMKLQSAIGQFARYQWPFGVLFCDIDNFKKLNDTYDSQFGDKVLRMAAQTLVSCSRSFDTVVRWAGEEFVVIIVNVQPAYIREMAEKLRVLIENSFIFHQNKKVSVTVSIGATLCRADDTADTIIQRADALMYQSKRLGRNRIAFE